MPAVLNAPDVYIEEMPSATHLITGVATSVAVFIGCSAQGSTGLSSLLLSWSDFQTAFGGLDPNSYLGYAVSHFFSNGGQQAYVVCLAPKISGVPAAIASAGGSLKLWANQSGVGGNALKVTITNISGKTFTLQVQQVVGTTVKTLESFPNVQIDPTLPQYVVSVINGLSQYITFVDPDNPSVAIAPPTAMPTAGSTALTGGIDAVLFQPTDQQFPTNVVAFATSGELDRIDFNLLCVPGLQDGPTISQLQQTCTNNLAFFIVDSPQTASVSSLASGPDANITAAPYAANSAYYFPWVQAPDPAAGNTVKSYPPCGVVAGIYAATDASRGVWKAPAGINAGLAGIAGLTQRLTSGENGVLNPTGINCLRQFKTFGNVVWGARTLVGSDAAGSQWKYVPIRRLALFLEASLIEGTQWVVFEPNDEPLWSQIRLNIGAFMQGLFLQGAFQGSTPQQAYFVKCDAENNPQSQIDAGIVTIRIGFAPLYPAEFVVIQIQQMSGQL